MGFADVIGAAAGLGVPLIGARGLPRSPQPEVKIDPANPAQVGITCIDF